MSKAQQGDFADVACACTEQVRLDFEPAQTRKHILPEQARDPVSVPPSVPSELCEVTCDCCNLTGMTVGIVKTLASADESSSTLTGCCHCCRSCVTASSCQAAARLWPSLCPPHRTSQVNCWSTCPAAMLLLPPCKPRWAALPALMVPEP